jgi:hypothetical protein
MRLRDVIQVVSSIEIPLPGSSDLLDDGEWDGDGEGDGFFGPMAA